MAEFPGITYMLFAVLVLLLVLAESVHATEMNCEEECIADYGWVTTYDGIKWPFLYIYPLSLYI